jgi:hypothetical protein
LFLQKIVAKIIIIAQGKTTVWLCSFFITGNVLAFLNKLSPTYVAFMLSFMSVVLGHSIKEDYFGTTETPHDHPG